MSIIKKTFSRHRMFRDITKERPDIVGLVSQTTPKDATTKIYECNNSIIIHSKTDKTNHASISNSKGYGYVQEWEITYIIDRILKVENKDVIMHVSKSSVIHLRTKEGSALIN